MYNKYISASEINQFAYCPYQWYYEKKYGHKYINQLREQMDSDSSLSNFKKGIEYHEKYYNDIINNRRKKILITAAILLLIIFGIIMGFYK
ncbi:MAG: hypothetical protein ACPL3A_04560 [Thermoanaerobacteraceae bacterium]